MIRLIAVLTIIFIGCRSREKTSPKFATIQTSILMTWDTSREELQSCSASLENKQLKLHIEKKLDSLSNYVVDIIQADTGYRIIVEQPWAVTDSAYVPRRFKILDQQLSLSKMSFQPNESVQGSLKLLLLGHEAYFRNDGEMKLREDWDTVYCAGTFSAIIK